MAVIFFAVPQFLFSCLLHNHPWSFAPFPALSPSPLSSLYWPPPCCFHPSLPTLSSSSAFSTPSLLPCTCTTLSGGCECWLPGGVINPSFCPRSLCVCVCVTVSMVLSKACALFTTHTHTWGRWEVSLLSAAGGIVSVAPARLVFSLFSLFSLFPLHQSPLLEWCAVVNFVVFFLHGLSSSFHHQPPPPLPCSSLFPVSASAL